MELKINEQAVAEAVGKAAETAIAQAVGSWAVQNEIRTKVEALIRPEEISAVVEAQVSAILSKGIEALVAEAVRGAASAMRLAVTACVKETMARMLYGARTDVPAYNAEAKLIYAGCRKAVGLDGDANEVR